MASSRNAAETGTAQVPRSCDGSVRAAPPLITSPWAASSLCVFDLVRVDPNQWPFIFCEVRGKKDSIDFGTPVLNRYRLDPNLAHIFVPAGGY
jgi:hypothetical protein